MRQGSPRMTRGDLNPCSEFQVVEEQEYLGRPARSLACLVQVETTGVQERSASFVDDVLDPPRQRPRILAHSHPRRRRPRQSRGSSDLRRAPPARRIAGYGKNIDSPRGASRRPAPETRIRPDRRPHLRRPIYSPIPIPDEAGATGLPRSQSSLNRSQAALHRSSSARAVS